MISSFLEVLAAAAMLFSCGYAAYVLAIRICPTAPLSVRGCAGVLIGAWLQAAVFEVLISLHAFRLGVALPVWLALAGIFHVGLTGPEHNPQRQAHADWQRFCRAAKSIWSSKARVVLIMTAVLSGAELLRGVLVPPLAWDSLTYQFVKPAMWVQTARIVTQVAPDAWSYYAYFPYTGNIFWAWAMLPVRGGLLLAPMGFAIWLFIQLAAYTTARLLGARQLTAVLAALTIGLTPAVYAYLISGYVDNTLLATFLLGMVFLIRTFTARPISTAGGRREAVLAAAGFGLTCGVKLSGAVMLGVAGTIVGLSLLRKRRSSGLGLTDMAGLGVKASPDQRVLMSWLGTMAASSAAALVGVMPYLRTWAQTGSPLYPKGLRLFGFEVLPGNEQLAAVLSGEIFHAEPYFSELDFLTITFVPCLQYTGLGLIAPLLIAVGCWGLMNLLRCKAVRIPVAFMLLCSVVAVAMLYVPGTSGMRAYWAAGCARFLMPAFACCAVWAATVESREWRGQRRLSLLLWFAAVGFGLIMALPRGWSMADAKAVGAGAAWLGVVSGGAFLWWKKGSGTFCLKGPKGAAHKRYLTPFSALIAGAALMGLIHVRASVRFPIYQAAHARRSWVTHRLRPEYAASWPIWKYFDTLPGHRIAVCAGWEPAGHNWYRYPLLGSRLQNNLLYVPISKDGSIIDYQQLAASRSARAASSRSARTASMLSDAAAGSSAPDFIAWLTRLLERRVQYVVSLAPDNTVESRWMKQHPELFEPVVESVDQKSRAYRLDGTETRLRLAKREKGSGTFCLKGPKDAAHKRFLTPFPAQLPIPNPMPKKP